MRFPEPIEAPDRYPFCWVPHGTYVEDDKLYLEETDEEFQLADECNCSAGPDSVCFYLPCITAMEAELEDHGWLPTRQAREESYESTPFERAPEGYPYRFTPSGTYRVGETLYLSASGNELEVPTECQCSTGACLFPPCAKEAERLMVEDWTNYLIQRDDEEFCISAAVVSKEVREHTAEYLDGAEPDLHPPAFYLDEQAGLSLLFHRPLDDASRVVGDLKAQLGARTLLPHKDPNDDQLYWWVDPTQRDLNATLNCVATEALGQAVFGPVGLTTELPLSMNLYPEQLLDRQPPAPNFGV